MTKCEDIVMAPVTEVITGASRNHRIVGVVSDISRISRRLPPYQLRLYSPIQDGGITRWQTIFVGHYQTIDEAIGFIKTICQ